MSHKPEYLASEIVGFGGTGPTGGAGATGSTGSPTGPTGGQGPPADFGADWGQFSTVGAGQQVFCAESSTTGFNTNDLEWDSVVRDDSYYTLGDSDTSITFNESGAYRISYSVTIKNLSSAGSESPSVGIFSVTDSTNSLEIATARSPAIIDISHQSLSDTVVAQFGAGEKIIIRQNAADDNVYLFAPHSLTIEYVGHFQPQFSSLRFDSARIDTDDVSRTFGLANEWSALVWGRPGGIPGFFGTSWINLFRSSGNIGMQRDALDFQMNLSGTGGTKSWSWLNVFQGGLDTWFCMVATWDGTTIRAYRNGVSLGEPDVKSPDSDITMIDDNTGNIEFYESQTGHLNCCVLWDSKLSDAEVLSLYNNGLGCEVDYMHGHENYASHANVQHYWRFGWMPVSPQINGFLGGKDCGLADPLIHITDYGEFNAMDQGDIFSTVFPGDDIYDPPVGYAQTHSYHKDDNTDLFRSFDSSLGFANTFSFGFWYRPETNSETDMICQAQSFGPATTSRIDFEAQGATSAGRVRINLYNSAGTLFKRQNWNSILTGNTWVHIMITWDGTTLAFLKDGVDQGAPDLNDTDNAGTMDDPGDRRVAFGGDTENGNHIQGWYHSYHAWDRVLTDTEITTVYNGGVGELDLEVDDDSTPSSASWDFNDAAGTNGNYVACDNTMSSITGATPASFSFMGWIKPETAQSNFDTIWGSTDSWNDWDDGFGVYFLNNNDIRFWVGLYTLDFVDVTIPNATGTWYHLAGAYDGTNGELTFWLNGVAVKNTTSIPATIPAGGSIEIARTGASQANGFFQGLVDEFSFYTDVITQGEVRYMYENGSDLTNADAPDNDVIWWRFGDVAADDPTASTGTVTDQSAAGSDNTGTPQASVGTVDAIAGSYHAKSGLVQFQQMGPNADDVVISNVGDNLDGDSLSLSNAQNETEIPT